MTYRLPILPPSLVGPSDKFKPRESFSPSQLAAFGGEGGCKRKWALRSIFGVSELKKSIATILGTLIHACLEHYMNGRTVYDLVAADGTLRIDERTLAEVTTIDPKKLAELVAEAPRRAIAGLHHLPDIKDPSLEVVEVERWIKLDTTKIIGGVTPITLNGKIDLSIRRVGVWYLYDHKSTKGRAAQRGLPADPWAYVKTPEQLMKDPQSVFYALDIMLRHNLDSLWCRWVYYLTDTKAHPQATKVDVELKREDVLKAAYEWLLVAVEMRELVRAAIAGTLSLEDIEPNIAACPSFGGCPYSIDKGGPCMPTGEVKLGSLIFPANTNTKEDDMSLQETFNQTQAYLGQQPLMPPPLPGNPLLPPEAVAPAVPAGMEHGPNGLKLIAPAGFQYNAAGGIEPIPAPVVVAPTPLVLPPAAAAVAAATSPVGAPPPIPDPPAAADAKAKGRPKGSKSNKVEDVLDLIVTAAKHNHILGSLTVAQLDAIRDVVEAA